MPGSSGDIGGHHVRRFPGGIGVDDLGGVESPDSLSGGHLGGEPPAKAGIVCEFAVEALDRDQSPAGSLTEIDDPEAAGAQSGLHWVFPDLPWIVGLERERLHGYLRQAALLAAGTLGPPVPTPSGVGVYGGLFRTGSFGGTHRGFPR